MLSAVFKVLQRKNSRDIILAPSLNTECVVKHLFCFNKLFGANILSICQWNSVCKNTGLSQLSGSICLRYKLKKTGLYCLVDTWLEHETVWNARLHEWLTRQLSVNCVELHKQWSKKCSGVGARTSADLIGFLFRLPRIHHRSFPDTREKL